MILQLARHESFECFYYDCQFISQFDYEDEYLYFGGDSILKIVTIKDIKNNWADYKYYLQGIHCFFQLLKGIGYNENLMSSNTKKAIIMLANNDIRLPEYVQTLLKHHKSNLCNKYYLNLNYFDFRDKLNFLKPRFIKQTNGCLDFYDIWIYFGVETLRFSMKDNYRFNQTFIDSLIEDFVKFAKSEFKLLF